ncbi:MAG TPA: CorA family divalent cation transporter [Bryobacteraceae bacterium]|nr:CorA family divalent cation transporter [Bryobacteraceae bacterium]HPT26878.1 CorA family divalent cation transporter [Bryobacteraceae bacterium]
MQAQALHLHTYFMLPFAVDKEAVMADHQKVWGEHDHWIEGLDQWIDDHGHAAGSPVAGKLGRWRRDSYRRFDMDSFAYQDMVFFHPFVRRVFFDVGEAFSSEIGGGESLVRCYAIPLTALGETGRKLIFEAEDARGRSASVWVNDLRLFLFANGIGILTLGVEGAHISISDALWVNEMMRKVYPSSGRQVREGRTPKRMTLRLEGGGEPQQLVEETFERCAMKSYAPPLSKIITELLYFANYQKQEFEPVLDERMIVYTYVSVDPASVEENFDQSEDYEILMSRLLYVDRLGDEYRYESDFTREQMRQQVYRRWAHQGTLYGFTSYSNVTLVMGRFDCDEHELREGFLVHRMFMSRYYLTVVVALFYRATLLDFSERTALVSRLLYKKYGTVEIEQRDVWLVGQIMADFQHFSNYWYFSELANKDEELEHFQMQVKAYRLDPMKSEIEQEIEKLSGYLERVFQMRNTESINRLAMLSLILGGGAMLTGFFGMNFGRAFADLFFNGARGGWAHYAAIAAVTAFVAGSMIFAVFLVVSNWPDYRTILMPSKKRVPQESLRRTLEMLEEDQED